MQVKLSATPILKPTSRVNWHISNAMKHGVPVVATHVAIEMMHLIAGTDVLVGSSPIELADQIVQLYTNCELWDRIVSGGISNLKLNYSPQAAKQQLNKAFSEAGLPPRGMGDKHHCQTTWSS